MPAAPKNRSPFALNDVRMFIAFRIFFNARFYYPVFTILFLDFGLKVEQFALLNAVWAATIVTMEVPSGALADIWGRRRLLVLAGGLMIVEMLLLCLAPRGASSLLFAIFLVNRFLSGTAEAAASGADEAIAYDALKAAGIEGAWSQVLGMQMRLQAMAFIAAMSIGAAVYDPAFMQRIVDAFGGGMTVTRATTLRLPVFLTLLMALLSLAAALKMDAPQDGLDDDCAPLETCGRSARDILRQTWEAGRWILRTPFALVVIAAGFLFDGVVRMVITLSSQYYRLIELPEALFGLIGSAIAAIGLFLPRLAVRLSDRRSPRFNLFLVAGAIFAGLAGVALCLPIVGLLPVIVLFSAMHLTGFFLSHYLNRITASHRRATVLSFKGLSLNLSYGLVGLLYSVLLAGLRPRTAASHPDVTSAGLENLVFIDSLQWFPWVFLVGFAAFLLFAARRVEGPSGAPRQPHDDPPAP